MNVKERIKDLLSRLNTGIFEKEEITALALLSSIAGESVFLLGPPGVAKSLIARRLKYAFKEAKVFEYLMSRFSTPDEIFGPVSISKLKADKYERITENYLPGATVVFLDEIWKAGPSIQNSLLTILNEKIYRNGEYEIQVPIKALVSASNELPGKEYGLEALWDRFLVRLVVKGIENRELFNKMISMPQVIFPGGTEGSISSDEYDEWTKKIDEIAVPDHVFNVIHVIREKIKAHNQNAENAENQIYVSDRRWRKTMRLMRASAFLNDRTEADLMDCFLIRHCIWSRENQIQALWAIVNDAIEEFGYISETDYQTIRNGIENLKTEIVRKTRIITDTRKTIIEPVYGDFYEVLNPPNKNCSLISRDVFNNLTWQNRLVHLCYWSEANRKGENYSNYDIRKSSSPFTIYINNAEYNMKTAITGDKRQRTRKPGSDETAAWDDQVKNLLRATAEIKNQIEKYRARNLAHLRVNIFVKPDLADLIESHLTGTWRNIEKLDLEIKEIQNNYMKLKDEEEILDD